MKMTTMVSKAKAREILMNGGKVFAAHCRRPEFGFALWSVAMIDAIADCRSYRFWI